MFDSEFAAASDAELVAAIEDGVRQEAIAGARRLAAIAELTRRRVGGNDDDDERALWAFDPWDSVAAEVAAAMGVGQRRASGQMRIAAALRDRLPRVAAMFWKGALSSRLVSTITWGTHLVDDENAVAAVDAAIAERATNWERLSEDKLRDAVGVQVAREDPAAVRRTQTATRGRDVTVGACDDDADTTAIWGRLLAPDAAVLKQRITAMIAGVCDKDPRSMGERRSDAMGAIANGNDTLACACGSTSCPAAAGRAPKSSVVIRVIADHAATDAVTETATTADRPAPPALLMGRGVLSNAVLAQAIRAGATITPIGTPGAEPEPRYRPSAELAEFVRMRDLFCRFPGCDIPADRCDIDHARPWPLGPTHASNLNCKCRTHHLMKTFWADGWKDTQLPDATVIWTAPSGKQYTTHPGSRLFYPAWDVTTAELPPPTSDPPPEAGRGLKMPRRQHARAAAVAAAITAERALNERDVPPF
jgi:hypothetical protein